VEAFGLAGERFRFLLAGGPLLLLVPPQGDPAACEDGGE
jgi:hypothetical protein